MHRMENDMARLVDIDNDKFWDILFDEACVEGNQAKRIEKELDKIANDDWIPVSERLPGKQKCFGVYLSFTNPVTSYVKKAWWINDHFEWDNGKNLKDNPTAWMRIQYPEPYKPKGEK